MILVARKMLSANSTCEKSRFQLRSLTIFKTSFIQPNIPTLTKESYQVTKLENKTKF